MEVKNAKKKSSVILEKIKMLTEDKIPIINQYKEQLHGKNLLPTITKTDDGLIKDSSKNQRHVTSVKNLVNIWSKFTEIATTSTKINFILEQIENEIKNKDNKQPIQNTNDIQKSEPPKNQDTLNKYSGIDLKISETNKEVDNNIEKMDIQNINMEICNANANKELPPIPEPGNLLSKDVIPDESFKQINNIETKNIQNIQSEIPVNDSKIDILKNINVIVHKLENENTFIRLPQNYEDMDGNQLVDSIKEIVEEVNLDQKNNNQSILCNELLDNLIIFQKEQKTKIDDFKEYIFPTLDFNVPKLFETSAINLFEYANFIKQTFRIILIDKEIESVGILCDIKGTPLNELGEKFQNTNITDLLCYFKLLCANPILAKYQIMSIFEGFQRKFFKDGLKLLTDEEYKILSEKFKNDYLSFPIISLKGSLSFFIENTFQTVEKNLIEKSELLNSDENEKIGLNTLNMEELEHFEDKIDKFSDLKMRGYTNRKKKAISDILVKPEDLDKFTVVQEKENEKSPFAHQYDIYKKYFSKEPEIYLSLSAEELNQRSLKSLNLNNAKYELFDKKDNSKKTTEWKADPSTFKLEKNLSPTRNSNRPSPGYIRPNSGVEYPSLQLSGSQTIMPGTFINYPNVYSPTLLPYVTPNFWNISDYNNKGYINSIANKAKEMYKESKILEKEKKKMEKKKSSKTNVKLTKLTLRKNETLGKNLMDQPFYILKPFSSDLAKKLEKQSIGNFYIFHDLFAQEYTLSYLNTSKSVKNLKITKNQNDQFCLESRADSFPDLNSLLDVLSHGGIEEI